MPGVGIRPPIPQQSCEWGPEEHCECNRRRNERRRWLPESNVLYSREGETQPCNSHFYQAPRLKITTGMVLNITFRS
jgi:hypothetical protein